MTKQPFGGDGRSPSRPGRQAERPSEIPRGGWKQILRRVKQRLGTDNVALLAAGVAFYGLLALFPSLIALISIYGLLFDPADLERQINSLAGSAPQEVQQLLREQLHGIVDASGGGLTLALVGSLGAASWSASNGMASLMQAVGIAYDEEENRSTIRLRLIALALTLGALVAFILAILLIAVLPPLLSGLGVGDVAKTIGNVLRWPLLAALGVAFLALVYRVGPDRVPAKWRWLSWGAGIATGLWLFASALFAVYADNFGSYNTTYGSLSAVVVRMLWLWITAFVVLLGAEINAEMERQTARDTTRGSPEPMGSRGAHVADTEPQRTEQTRRDRA